MRTYTIDDIRALKPAPCYDPSRYLAEDWSGTLLDMLDVNACPVQDRIWVVLGFLDDRTRRLFTAWCARACMGIVEGLRARVRPDLRCDRTIRVWSGER